MSEQKSKMTGRDMLKVLGLESTEMKINRLEADNAALLAACKELWESVKEYGRIGYEGSRLLEAMSEAKAAIAQAEQSNQPSGGREGS